MDLTRILQRTRGISRDSPFSLGEPATDGQHPIQPVGATVRRPQRLPRKSRVKNSIHSPRRRKPNDATMPESPLAPDAMTAFLNQFCRHIVCLHGFDVRLVADKNSDGMSRWDPQNFYVSAFVLSIRGTWFLVTAGHVLRELDKRLEGRRLVRSHLMDGTASGSKFPPIPFVLGRTPQWHEYDEEQGTDYALIPLRDGFVRPLMAGGVIALDESAVCGLNVDATEYYLLGFPEAAIRTTSQRADGQVHVTTDLGTPLLPIQRLEAPPAHMISKWPRFYAKVPDFISREGRTNGVPKSIVGMSGGPIFAVKRTSSRSCTYWVIAVQSGWDEKARVLAACPILPLVRIPEQRIGSHEAKLTGPAA